VSSPDAAAIAEPADHDRNDQRTGTLAGVVAYSLWGVFPLVFHQLEEVGAGEILAHRVVWAFVVVVALLAVRRERHWFAGVRATPGALPRLSAAAVLVGTNWLVYIWAVNHGHVVEAALGYYINPLLTVALGVVVLGEHLRRLQVAAIGLGAAAVAVLTLAYGRVPWVALVLAGTFAAYSFLKKAVPVGAVTSLATETLVLLPLATAALVVLQTRGTGALGHGSVGRDLLLVSLGAVTAGPLILFGVAARRIPLSLLGLLQYLTPTLQLVCGVALLGEALPPARLAGFVLVWAALAVLAADALGSARRRAAEPVSLPPPAAEAA
jgi:chloramphenicol-sensitive protein RarD